MGERPQPTLDDLHDSAPLRDFVGAAGEACGVESMPVPAAAATWSRLAAAWLVLLARHARRSTIAFVWAVDGEPRALSVATEQPFAGLEAELVGAAASAAPPWPQGRWVSGVLFESAGRPSGLMADLTIRLATVDRTGELCWDPNVYERLSIAPLCRQWSALIAAARGKLPGGRLPRIDAAERQRVISDFNVERLPVPSDATLAGLIEQQCRRMPAAVCAAHRGRSLRFDELETSANRLARLLIECGVGAGTHVAIVDERGLDFLIAMVAIWKAGGAYVPVDPSYPAERMRHMLVDSEAPVAVIGRAVLERSVGLLSGCGSLRDLICPAAETPAAPTAGPARLWSRAELLQRSPAALRPRCRATDPAYMIYTSGSTGRPKGAIVRHDGAVNHLYAQAHALGAQAISRFLQSAPSSSDISVWQFVAPLVFGGTTVIVDDPTDVAAVLRAIREHRLSLVELVPALLRWFAAHAAGLPASERELPDLRWMMITGESAPVELVNAWLAVYPQVPVVNAYGPTEASDDVAQAVIRRRLPPGRSTVPIGRPLANLDLYVLDADLEPLPVGVPGEICIAGVGVGNGYWKQPDKTRQAFVANPFEGGAGPVIYRTGDLGRWRDDGQLECLGRLDHQVQLRGHRIELQEIEAVLEAHPQIAQAVVRAFHDGRGDGELVAFVVMRAPAATDDELRRHCAARLPGYMLPATVVRLPAMPLNPAGKVDRQTLQRPSSLASLDMPQGRLPRNDLERRLILLWQQELEVPRLGIDDDFFALGGDSLAALAIAVGAGREGLALRSADVLAHPSVARLAVFAAASRRTEPPRPESSATPLLAVEPLPPGLRDAVLARDAGVESARPLDPPQLGIFLHALLAADKSAYLDQYCYRIEGELDVPAFASAWRQVAARHEALRTDFVRRQVPMPLQRVRREVDIVLPLLDLSTLPAMQRDTARQQAAAQQRATGFDLARAPLMRLLLVREQADLHTLIWTHHHLMLDGWSLALVLDEVAAIHDALRSGRAPALPPVAPRSRYSEWIAARDISPAEAFWRAELAAVADAPSWTTPAPNPPTAGLGEVDLQLEGLDSRALSACAAGHGVTPTTLLQAAWALTLGRLTRSSDLVFGVVTSGRELPIQDLANMVGLFVTTLPLRVAIGRRAEPDLGRWLADLQLRAATVREHESVPLARIARWAGMVPGETLFDTLFVMSNYPAPSRAAGTGLRLQQAEFRTVPAYPLSLIVTPGPALELRLVHDRRLLDRGHAQRLGDDLVQHLRALVAGRDPRPDR